VATPVHEKMFTKYRLHISKASLTTRIRTASSFIAAASPVRIVLGILQVAVADGGIIEVCLGGAAAGVEVSCTSLP